MGRTLAFAAFMLSLTLSSEASAQVARFERFSYRGWAREPVAVPAGAYRNPILPGYYPDPSVLRVGTQYYLVNSSFAHFPGLPLFASSDLVHWTQIGNAIDRAGQIDLGGRAVSEGLFAPDISYHAGTFYIANTCVECGGNFVISSRDPAGPWSDPVWLPFEGIDPSIYWEDDRAYIVNNRAPDEPPRYDGHRAIWLQEFDWRAGKMVGPATQIVNGGVDLSKRPIWIEGPHLIRRDGWYYLIAAEGGTAENHSQVVFRSKALRGPYEPFAGNPILTQRDLPGDRADPVTSAGHAKFVQTPAGDWWATFLATRPYSGDLYATGRETFLLPVTWKDGWPIILPRGTPVPLVAPRPALPAPSATPALPAGDVAYVDAFDGERLGPAWIGVRIPATPFHRLTGGALELRSAAPLGDRGGTPAFLGRRLQHQRATIATTLTFQPERDGARAGLAAVQDDMSNLFFGIVRRGGERSVALYMRNGAASDTLVAHAPIANDGAVTLTIEIAGGTLRFAFRTGDGPTWTLARDVDLAPLTTARAGGFVGTVFGPYTYTPSAARE